LRWMHSPHCCTLTSLDLPMQNVLLMHEHQCQRHLDEVIQYFVLTQGDAFAMLQIGGQIAAFTVAAKETEESNEEANREY
jgi:hypothetical protein